TGMLDYGSSDHPIGRSLGLVANISFSLSIRKYTRDAKLLYVSYSFTQQSAFTRVNQHSVENRKRMNCLSGKKRGKSSSIIATKIVLSMYNRVPVTSQVAKEKAQS